MNINDVMTLTEACKRWGLSESAVRMSIHRGRFVEGKEIRKSGNAWLITVQGMERVFGPINKEKTGQ